MKTVLITGATDGIGLELAKLYGDKGYRLILHGRRPLEQLDPELFRENNYLRVDLTSKNLGQTVDAWLQKAGVSELDIVIHNAGAGWVGDLRSQPVEHLTRVNLWAPILLTRVLLPQLIKARGKLVFVSSMVTTLPTPKFSIYGATKAALEGFARSLRLELRESGVSVQVLRPGATKTGIHEKSGLEQSRTKNFAEPRLVAEQMMRVVDGKRRAATIGSLNKVIRFLGRLAFQPGLRSRPPRRVLITGGADGIGRALVKRYAKSGSHVTWVDRDEVRSAHLLKELASDRYRGEFVSSCLLTEPFSWLDGREPFDLVVHNAGISSSGHFEKLSTTEQERVVRLNLEVPMLLTQTLTAGRWLPDESGIIFISSLSHFCSYPGASVYAGTKDGIAHFARSLGWNTRRVLTVFPGPTRTAHARRYSPDNSRESARMSPERLADFIYRAQQRGARTLLPGWRAKLTAFLGSLFPSITERLMDRLLLQKFENQRST